MNLLDVCIQAGFCQIRSHIYCIGTLEIFFIENWKRKMLNFGCPKSDFPTLIYFYECESQSQGASVPMDAY